MQFLCTRVLANYLTWYREIRLSRTSSLHSSVYQVRLHTRPLYAVHLHISLRGTFKSRVIKKYNNTTTVKDVKMTTYISPKLEFCIIPILYIYYTNRNSRPGGSLVCILHSFHNTRLYLHEEWHSITPRQLLD